MQRLYTKYLYAAFVLFFTLLACNLSAQSKKGNIWYFGDSLGVDFNTAIPTPLTDGVLLNGSPGGCSSGTQGEGCASISDSNGNILFYASGTTIWDRNHMVMPDGNSLNGNRSTTQAVLITPVIDSVDQYYVFTLEHQGLPNGLQYSVVDMSLPGNGISDGDVVTGKKNIPLLTPVAEKITAILHEDQIRYWIVVHGYGNDNYYAFLIDETGINTTPVVSTIGDSVSTTLESIGQMKSSKDGKKIVSAIKGNAPFTPIGRIELVDFDNCTGEVSNAEIISNSNASFYGVSFSPNDSLIYANDELGGVVYQYDRYADTIRNTQTIVGSIGGISIGSMQLAPDGKIYIANFLFNALSTIEDPNNKSNPNVIDGSFPLGSRCSMIGLPDFFNYYDKDTPTFDFAGPDTTICLNDMITIGNPLSDTSLNYSWSPTNSLSDPNSSITLAMPNATTQYIVSATNACTTKLDSVTINVVIPSSIGIGTDTTICLNQEIMIGNANADTSLTYIWTPDSNLNTPNNPTTLASPITTTTYILTGSDTCIATIDSITISVSTSDSISLGNDTTVCLGDQVTLVANNKDIYEWSSNSIVISSDSFVNVTINSNLNIHLKTTSPCGADSTNKNIFAEDCTLETIVYIPNAFSPYDNHNNVFKAFGENFTILDLFIYDRLGNLLYHAQNDESGWDATNNDIRINPQVYLYRMIIETVDQEREEFTGNVTLFY